MKKPFFFLLFFLLIRQISTAQQTTLPPFIKDSLDQHIAQALKEWQIPGLAVAIVKDGQLVFSKGYGVREWGKPDKVDENTLFMIGSNTKAFTGTALAMLEEEKKLSMDDKVNQYLPDFKLSDPCIGAQVTLRDLLCHRLGLETFQGDFTYWGSKLSRREIIEKLGKQPIKLPFRSKFGYCNAAFLAAGEVIPVVSGIPWEMYVKEKILTPLQMNRSVTLAAELAKAENTASPHTLYLGKLNKLPVVELDNLAPAGSISSSVKEMANWLLVNLDTGKLNDKQVLPKSVFAKTQNGVMVVSGSKNAFFKRQFQLYGLGWFLHDYAGKRVVEHTGGVDGFVTSTLLLPEERLGIVVLTNSDQNGFYEALRWQIADAFLKEPYRNYSKMFLDYDKQAKKMEQDRINHLKEKVAKKNPPALTIESYTGTYEHPVYGSVEVKAIKGQLAIGFSNHPKLSVSLESIGGNDFMINYNNPTLGIHLTVFTVEDGKVKSLTLKVNDFVEFQPYTFVKIK